MWTAPLYPAREEFLVTLGCIAWRLSRRLNMDGPFRPSEKTAAVLDGTEHPV
ncbi:MAG: hypothetical protein JW909_11675 [Planctomycetes bacterium]|nr:hypothetical protein [Planctomycetota bacterium]